MLILILAGFGLIFGSFVNALVWRIHEQETSKSKSKKLSVLKGRSMCPNCKHVLAEKDLIPILSWLLLQGKCRYCKKPISVQYPLVEAATAVLFVCSYIWWPVVFAGAADVAIFILWLALLVGFMALTVYDLRWFVLPNRIIYPLFGIALVQSFLILTISYKPLESLINMVLAVFVGGGIFYVLFQLSGGKWIGGGDVRLGWLLGLIAGTPARSVLFIFLASLLGVLISLPMLASKRLTRTSLIPFGPFLILGLVIVVLFGTNIIDWYQHTLVGL